MKTLLEKAVDILRDVVETRFDGNKRQATFAFGLKDPSILGQWLSGRRNPSFTSIAPILEKLGANLVMPDEKFAEYDLIPKVAAIAGAGASEITNGEEEGLYAFRKDFIASQAISPKNSILMSVMGDSMTPLFFDGDTILIDKSDKEIMDGKIYVVTLGGELRVKRILKSIRGIVLHSENPAYPDIPVLPEDLDSFVIHGRVRWFGRIV